MSAVLSPSPRQRFFDSTGNPLSGGKLYSYQAGSSTQMATYTDSTGTTPNTNPVILDANGEADIWLPENTAYKFRLTDASDVTQWTVDNISVINSQSSSASQWISPGFAPTYVAPAQFSVAGDKRDTFQVNRRTQATCTAGTLYGSITDSTYANNVTTVTVKMDSGALDNGLSIVNVGLLTPINDALPRNIFQYFGIAGGTADALTVTLSPVPPALTDGLEIKVRASSANTTTTPTLNVNALGAKTITKQGGQALVAGDIRANQECLFRYVSGGGWEILNPASLIPMDVPAGSVVQVVNATYTTQTSNTTTTYADTGLTASITPKYATSKIMAIVTSHLGVSTGSTITVGHKLQRVLGGTPTDVITDPAAVKLNVNSDWDVTLGANLMALDAPNTTSQLTYKTQFAQLAFSGGYGGATNAQPNNTPSSIVLMEIR